jgi:hypothetical protein
LTLRSGSLHDLSTPDTRRLKATPGLANVSETELIDCGEAGDFMCLIGIHLQSPVLQQAGAFLLGRHHRHIKGQRPDPPLHQRSAQRLG